MASHRSETVRLAPHELIVVAETGVPPAARAIVDTDLSDYPELPSNHPQSERRKSERKKFITQNESNVEQRARVTLRAWTTLFESLRSCCVNKAPLLSFELYEICALDRQGISGGYLFDGPAWLDVSFSTGSRGMARGQNRTRSSVPLH